MQQEGSRGGTRCAFCDEPIGSDLDDPDAIYQEVTSWVTGPKKQSPILREPTGRIAHAECAKKLALGQSFDQEQIPGL